MTAGLPLFLSISFMLPLLASRGLAHKTPSFSETTGRPAHIVIAPRLLGQNGQITVRILERAGQAGLTDSVFWTWPAGKLSREGSVGRMYVVGMVSDLVSMECSIVGRVRWMVSMMCGLVNMVCGLVCMVCGFVSRVCGIVSRVCCMASMVCGVISMVCDIISRVSWMLGMVCGLVSMMCNLVSMVCGILSRVC